METNFNLGSLKIVYNPLMEYFKNIQNKVSQNIEWLNSEGVGSASGDNTASINSSKNAEDLDMFTKLQASLKMIGLNGLVRVVELNQEAFEYTNKVKDIKTRLKIFEEIQRNLITVDNYLKQLVNGALDEPTKLFNSYSALAGLINKPVEIRDLFFPKLDLLSSKNNLKLNKELRIGKVINSQNKDKLIEELTFYRDHINNALNEIFRSIDNGLSSIEEKNDYHAECKAIYDTLTKVQLHKISKSYYILFGIQKLLVSISTPIRNDAFDKIISNNLSGLKTNLKNIIKNIEFLIEDLLSLKDNEKTGNLKTNEIITKETLLFIINVVNENQSLRDMPIFKELNDYFNFNFYANQLKGLPLETTIAQDNPGLIKELENFLLELKEEVILLTGKSLSQNMFDSHLSKVISLANKFKNLTQQDKYFSEFLDVFISFNTKIKNREIEFNSDVKKELSLSVVLLEFTVLLLLSQDKNNDYLKSEVSLEIKRLRNIMNGVDNSALPLPSLDIKTKRSEERKVLLKIFEELSKDLNNNEEVLDNIIRTGDVDKEELIPVLQSLENTYGILVLLKNNNLSLVVNKIKDVWETVSNKNLTSVSEDLMKNSISWLSGLTLYVNAYKENNLLEAEEIEFKILDGFKAYFGENVTLQEEDSTYMDTIDVFVDAPIDVESVAETEVATSFDGEVKEISHKVVDTKEKEQITDITEHEEVLTSPSTQIIEKAIESKDEVKMVPEIVVGKKESFVPEALDKDVKVHQSYPLVEDINTGDEMIDFFFMEMDEVKENLESGLAQLSEDFSDKEALTTVRRSFHTLKGSGRMVNLNNLAEVAWIVEERINSLLALNKGVNPNMLEAINYIVSRIYSWKDDLVNNHKAVFSFEKERDIFYSLFDKVENDTQNLQEITVSDDKSLDVEEFNMEDITTATDDTVDEENVVEEISHTQDSQSVEENAEEMVEISHDINEDSHFEGDITDTTLISEEMDSENNEVAEEDNVSVSISNTEDLVESLENMNVSSESVYQSQIKETENQEELLESESWSDITNKSEKQATEDSYINILGKDIPVDLYNLFKEESAQHLLELRNFVHSPKNVKRVILTHDFMRHAHTLSSIAKTVNLEEFGKLVTEVEEIANISLEKEVELSKAEMATLKYIVDNLDLFQDPNNDLTSKSEHYIDVMDTAHELKGELINKSNYMSLESEKSATASYSKENIVLELKELFKSEEFKEIISSEVKRTLDEQITKEKSALESVELNINNIEEKMVENLKDTFSNLLSKEFGSIKEDILKDLSSANDNTIKSLEEKFNALNKEKEEQLEDISKLREELRVLTEVVKKKSSKKSPRVFSTEMVVSGQDSNRHREKEEAIVKLFEEHPSLNLFFEEKISTVVNEIDEDMFEISSSEIEEMFNNINIIFDRIKNDNVEDKDISSLKRDIHTLKGSVRMYGNNQMGAIAHRLESLLDYAENHNVALNDVYLILYSETEKLKFLNKNFLHPLTVEQAQWLDSFLINSVQGDEVDNLIEMLPTLYQEDNKDDRGLNTQYIKVMSALLDSLINDAGEIRLSRTTLEGTLEASRKLINDLKSSSVKVQKMLKEVELKAEVQIMSQESNLTDPNKNFDPLEFDRYTRLQELTRFIHEAVEDIKDSVSHMDGLHRNQENAIIKQSILTDNILDSLMDVRLVSVDSIADKLYKVVRLAAKDTGKIVMLNLYGEKHEVDRVVLERVQHPLEHLLRNCVIHGIESPEDRKKLGKERNGSIDIDISVDGNFIIFNISDDGRGIQLNEIKKRAIAKGLLDKDGDYSDEELKELIFKPGFSTASELSQNAGRGIGMDVVRSEVLSLGGSIEINTEENVGTSFIIALPLSVATNQAMLTTINDKLFAIPAALIEEVVSLKADQLKEGYKNKLVKFRDKEYPLYYIGHLTGIFEANVLPSFSVYNTLLIISYLGQEIILHVDNLKTIEEVVIKSAGNMLGKINGLLGLTLLGDGTQGVVINPVLLVEHFNKFIVSKDIVSIEETNTVEKISNQKTVLVVDDSITIRKATSKVLEKNNFNVVLAKDGENALEQLQSITPDIILSDIEMPIMDGFELVKHIRNIAHLKDIPIIMITSRTADKHKEYAFSLGANAFIGKPYQEDNLINTINEFLVL